MFILYYIIDAALGCTLDVFQKGQKHGGHTGRQKQRAAGKRHSLTNTQYQSSSYIGADSRDPNCFLPICGKWVK